MKASLALRLLLAMLAAAPPAPAHDLVLAHGRVMDPASGLDAVRHVGITAGKISAISETPLHGGVVVDVAGRVVAPGFIDLHAHGQTTSDLQIKAQDGVTTALEMDQPWLASQSAHRLRRHRLDGHRRAAHRAEL
jgi:dihydroorotase-like cyclic amidohydrolase